VLGGDKLVAERLRDLLGAIHDLVELTRDRRLSAGLLRIARDLSFDARAKVAYRSAELVKERDDDPLVLLQEGEQEVRVIDERIAVPTGDGQRLIERLGTFHGQPIGADHRWGILRRYSIRR
jgi:hypothetical protein